ncbi:MAG TPA: hypothetical protein DDW52_11230 [Planctomycetaceae bacterium]|nr:hypothetical protein [Planctomycetaceae bacterium]
MQSLARPVRDLLWAVNSPLLIRLTSQASVPSCRLTPSDIDSDHLRGYLSSYDERRVGRYFERLIVYWIQYICGYEIVAHSRQVIDGNRTVGEVDLLFRDSFGHVNHWEMACKFYLRFDSKDTRTAKYIGPDSRDTLDRKTRRILEHQLPLGTRYFSGVDAQDAVVKGRIFYHWRNSARVSAPVELAPDHLRGKWLWARELPEWLGSSRLWYRVMRKPYWLSDEVANSSGDDILPVEEALELLSNHFRNDGRPTLVCGFRDDSARAVELDRWFIVPDGWPNETT